MITTEPSALETEVSSAANDFKVSGAGQRIRAALRRNRSAQDETILPEHLWRDLPGPELVRHRNALELIRLFGDPFGSDFQDVDRELLAALQKPLHTVALMVGSLWRGPLEAIAGEFLGLDCILPPPHSRTYPNARRLVTSPDPLSRPLERIVSRVAAQLRNRSVYELALGTAEALTDAEVLELSQQRSAFSQECQPHQGEVLRAWRDRVMAAFASRSADVPTELLALERLISATVQTLVSLACWDHEIDVASIGEVRDVAISDDLPAGLELSMHDSLGPALTTMGSAFRLRSNGKLIGLCMTAGIRVAISQEDGEKVDLSVIRLSSFEQCGAS